MDLATLEASRVPADTLLEMPEDPVDSELEISARNKLHYYFGQEELSRTRRIHNENKALRDVLVEHDLRPFDPKAVAKYKLKRANRLAGRARRLARFVTAFARDEDNSPPHPESNIAVAANLAIIGGILATLAAGIAVLGNGLWVTGLTAIVFLAFTALSILYRVALIVPWPVWETSSFSEWRQQVPEYALQHALYIKDALPQCDLRIESLRMPERVPDPFLVAFVFNAKREVVPIYLEAWDENDFKQTRVEVDTALEALD